MISKAMMALATVFVLLGAFTICAPSASASSKVVDVVETEKVSFSYDVPAELLDALNEVCPDLIPYYDAWQGEQLTLAVDGMVHVNLKAWEKKDCIDVKVQAFWHGTITAYIAGEEMLEISIKNLQLMAHVELSEDRCLESVIINVHMNGELSTVTDLIDPFQLDLDAHLIVHYMNGDLTIKAWLPEFLDLDILDI